MKRQFLCWRYVASFVVSTALLGFGVLWWMRAPAVADRPPDVYLLMVDTLRADHLSLYGYSRPTSKALDGLSESALVFTTALAPSSWTLPSVGSLFTSLYPSVHGLRAKAGGTLALRSLRTDAVTLAEVYKRAGYYTAAIIGNAWLSTETGTQRGFDYYLVRHGMRAPKLNELARETLEAAPKNRPIFLYLHYMDPHGPYRSPKLPPEVLGPVEGEDQMLPEQAVPHVRKLVDMQHQPWPADEGLTVGYYIDAYDRTIYNWDLEFGKLVAYLEETGRLDRSVLTLVADHGEELYERGGWNHGTSLFQEQTRIPWILRVPGGTLRGRISDPVNLLDVAPTLLAASGLPTPSTMKGLDVRTGAPRRLLFAEVLSCRGNWGSCRQHAVWDWPLKLSLFQKRTQAYDLSKDPGEASAMPPEPRLIKAVADWSAGNVKLAQQPDEATLERLRALGYMD